MSQDYMLCPGCKSYVRFAEYESHIKGDHKTNKWEPPAATAIPQPGAYPLPAKKQGLLAEIKQMWRDHQAAFVAWSLIMFIIGYVADFIRV